MVYFTDHIVPSFMGARDSLDPNNERVIWKDKQGKKKIALSNYNFIDSNSKVKYYYNYDKPPENLELDFTTKELISYIPLNFFDSRKSGIGRHGKHLLNKYEESLTIRDSSSLEDAISCIKLWEGPAEDEPGYDPNNLAPGDKYSWQTIHSSYDKRFFREFWPRFNKHYYSKFFYDKTKMIAYSILTREPNIDGELIYLFGKAATHLYPGLSKFTDLYIVKSWQQEYNKPVQLNWMDSGKSLLNYKKSVFPEWTEKSIYYAVQK